MKPYEEDGFAGIVFQALNNARKKGEFDFEIYHLMLDGSDAYEPNPTIIIRPEENRMNIVAKCFAEKREVHVSYSQSYHGKAKNIVH